MAARRRASGMASQAPVQGSQCPQGGESHSRRATTAPQRALSVVLGSMSEKQFQRYVVDGLKRRGWIVWVVPDMRRTAAGLPDIIAVHPTQVPRRVLFWELKTMRGRVRPEQKIALAALNDVYGVDARVIRPDDWARESAALSPAATCDDDAGGGE